ncbi:uncharacterized protein DS421_16g545730 [Arachis hypogaea]|nr:uncharacterized protein DS421_16g545730 [Arachis hypogaea]
MTIRIIYSPNPNKSLDIANSPLQFTSLYNINTRSIFNLVHCVVRIQNYLKL